MSDSGGSDGSDVQLKVDIEYYIPNLSFIPPRSTQLTISRMHSGGRRSAILDFSHIIELTDISIPACKSLSSFIVEAWPFSMKNAPSIDATEFFTVAISLDICDHNFVVSSITPTVLTQFIRVTAIGRYGTSNAQTVINLGNFHGRPACVRLSATKEQNANKCKSTPESTSTFTSTSSSDYSEIQSKTITSAFRITDTVVATKAGCALEQYIRSMQNYAESLGCQYELACSELKSLISIPSSNLSSFSARVGNTFRIPSKQAVIRSYKKCVAIQLQRSRVQHAIRLIQSMSNSSQINVAMKYSETNLSNTFSELEIHCEMMLNLLLSICPHILKRKQQITQDAIFTSSSADTVFKNLMEFPHPRIRVQATGVLLSYYAPFPNWGSFLVSCLTQHLTADNFRNLCPSQSHFFCNVLVLGQRSLAIPGKGEEVIDSLLNLVATVLPKSGEQVKADVNFKFLTVALLLVSHLTETILSMNEAFMSKLNPHILSLLSTVVSGAGFANDFFDSPSKNNPSRSCPDEVTPSESTHKTKTKPTKKHLWNAASSEYGKISTGTFFSKLYKILTE